MRHMPILLLALLSSQALAQPLPPMPQRPQPRTALDVELPAAPNLQLYGRGAPGRLAVGTDGTHYVLTNSFRLTADPLQPERNARVELRALSADGKPKFHTLLPVAHHLDAKGSDIESLGVVALSAGESAVFLGARNDGLDQPLLGTGVAMFYRLGASGAVVRAAPVGPPNVRGSGSQSGKSASYSTRFYVPTTDNGMLAGGGYGTGPYAWWIGKFDSDGSSPWQAGNGPGVPENVYALAARPDGTAVSVVLEQRPDVAQSDWYIARFASDGRRLERTRIDAEGNVFVILPNGYMAVTSAYDTARPPELVRLDDAGRVTSRVPWPYEKTHYAIADGDGIAAIACYRVDGPPCYVVRAGLDGKVRWQSPPATVSDIARTPDGQIAALVWSNDGMRARLVRYADPP